MPNENIWTWLQTKGTIFKVISNPDRGTIEVINEKGETIIRKTNLSRRQVELVEKNFLRFVAKKLNSNKKPPFGKPNDSFDPMVA
jgi:hypothetical protein